MSDIVSWALFRIIGIVLMGVALWAWLASYDRRAEKKLKERKLFTPADPRWPRSHATPPGPVPPVPPRWTVGHVGHLEPTSPWPRGSEPAGSVKELRPGETIGFPSEDQRLAKLEARKASLDMAKDLPRVLHRVVRSLHDGQCPKCGHIDDDSVFKLFGAMDANMDPELIGWECPKCEFSLSKEEAEKALALFQPYMVECVAKFEQWRKEEYGKAQNESTTDRDNPSDAGPDGPSGGAPSDPMDGHPGEPSP